MLSLSPRTTASLLLQARANVSRAALLGLTVVKWRSLGGSGWTAENGHVPGAARSLEFDESLHPRDEHGRFGPGDRLMRSDDGYLNPGSADVMFHGTSSEVLASIKEHGLVPSGSAGADAAAKANGWSHVEKFKTAEREGSVFMAYDSKTAQQYGRWAAGVHPGSKAVLLAVKIPSGMKDRIKADEHEAQGIRFTDKIKPEWIRLVDSHGELRALEAVTIFAVVMVKDDLRSATSSRDATPVHRAADANYRQTMLVISAAFMRGRKALRGSLRAAGDVEGHEYAPGKWRALELRTAISTADISSCVSAIRAALLENLPPVLIKTFVAGGNAGIAALPKRRAAAALRALKPQKAREPHDTKGNFGLAFNVTDPRAVAWAKEHAAELADGISETSREHIQNAIARGLEGEDAYDEILDAVGDETRADMISRTETMWAANEGQQAGWDAAVEEGLLPDDARVEWISTSDCCDICEALDGQTRPIDGEYEDEDGADGPPQHPNCRCTEGISA